MAKRGRPPKYDKPMTSTEKSQEHRARINQKGKKQIYISISGDMVNTIDEIVDFYYLPGRAEVIKCLLKGQLVKVKKEMDNIREGNEEITYPVDDEVIDKILASIQNKHWDALCEKLSNDVH